MAQSSNIEIPARFSFRPYSARWVVAQAQTIGWWEELKLFGNIPPIGLPAIKPLKTALPHGGDKVLVRVHIGSAATPLGNAIGFWLGSPLNNYEVKIDRADIPADVLLPHENRRNTPDIAGREFVVLACQKPEFETFLLELKREDTERNAWKMREEFFELENEIWGLSRFLNRWGLWNYKRGYDAGLGEKRHGFVLAFPHLLWEQREHYRRALTRTPRAWLSAENHLSFSTLSEPPYFIVERFYCEDAIKATITIDHLMNFKFGICKRPDCRKLFKRETQQKRLYCCQYCAHLESVRAQRREAARQRSKAAKRKGA